jgi:hypothetical protein
MPDLVCPSCGAGHEATERFCRDCGLPHQAEAELIEGLLLEQGVPSVAKRTLGFDVPDFLASGPRDIFVPASGADVARDVLATAGTATPGRATARPWVRAMAVAVAVLLLLASVAGVLAAIF